MNASGLQPFVKVAEIHVIFRCTRNDCRAFSAMGNGFALILPADIYVKSSVVVNEKKEVSAVIWYRSAAVDEALLYATSFR